MVFGVVSKRAEANRTIFNTGSQDELEIAKQKSIDILRGRATQRAIGNADEFKVSRVEIDDLKMAHTRFQQTVGGVPVWGGEAIVHLNSDGELFTLTDDLAETVTVNTTPNFTTKEAIRFARGMYRGSANLTERPTADLWIYRGEDRDHLAYRVSMRREDGTDKTAMPVIFVDAQTGEKVFEYDNLQTASVTGSGVSLYSGTISLTTYQNGTTYYLENVGSKVGTFNYSNGTTTATRFSDTDNIWNSTAQKAGVDAQYGAVATYNYYLNVHGRNGINGSGGPGTTTSIDGVTSLVSSRVHYSTNYNNAFWNGSYMTYGDGDGTTFTPLVTLDIAGHEMTHGVTQFTANLTYSNQSGALNESISDIFGAMIERNARGGVVNADTWKIGEQAYTPTTAGDALRYMDNPTLGGQPDNMATYVNTTSDNGGVHTNSGIPNYAFYLMAQGGTTSRGATVVGMGATNAEKIWYKALTSYMTASTNFAGARTATLSAASALFGATSTQYASVDSGWCAVGVGTCSTGTPTPTPSGTELITNGGFETSVSPWVVSGTGASYVANGSSPHGGTGYIYFGNINSAAGQYYEQVTIPSTAPANLSFWLNVTSAETTTTTQYDKLFVEVRNTAGTLLTTVATYSNLNKVAATTTYSQKSFSLAAYKGQTVRLQFRTTTDSSAITTFRVDDVSLK